MSLGYLSPFDSELVIDLNVMIQSLLDAKQITPAAAQRLFLRVNRGY